MRQFGGARDGNIAMTFALSAVPMLLLIATGLQFSNAEKAATRAQAAVDAAALGAANASPERRNTIADNLIRAGLANVDATINSITHTPEVPGAADTSYQVSVSVTVPNYLFSNLVPNNTLTRAATATMTSGSAATSGNAVNSSACALLVDPAAAQALQASGSTSVNASGCEIDVASTSSTAVYFSGSNTWNVAKICAAGGGMVSGSYAPGGYNSSGVLVPTNISTNCAVANDTAIAASLPKVSIPSAPPAPATPAAPATCAYTNQSFSSPQTFASGAVFCGTTNFGGWMGDLTLTNATFTGPVALGGSMNSLTMTNCVFFSSLSATGWAGSAEIDGIAVYGAAALGGLPVQMSSASAQNVFYGDLTFSGSNIEALRNVTVYGALTSNGSNRISIAGSFAPYGNLSLSGSSSLSLPSQPATNFYGTVSLSGSPSLALGAGLATFQNVVSLSGSSRLTGSGVTLYFAKALATFSTSGSSQTTLSAPTSQSSAYYDILMFEPDGLANTGFSLTASAVAPYAGLIYLPSRNVTFSGASGTTSPDTLTVVFNTLTFADSNTWSFQPDSNWNFQTTTTTTAIAPSAYLSR